MHLADNLNMCKMEHYGDSDLKNVIALDQSKTSATYSFPPLYGISRFAPQHSLIFMFIQSALLFKAAFLSGSRFDPTTFGAQK